MMTNPSVIFADEPTTGLDSFIAESVMRIFRLLANRGNALNLYRLFGFYSFAVPLLWQHLCNNKVVGLRQISRP